MSIHKIGREAIILALKGIGTTIALEIAEGLEQGILAIPEISPMLYESATDYFIDAQAIALVKKNPWVIDTNKEAEDYAFKKFLKAEEKCKEVNLTFDRELRNNFEFRTVFETARHFVERILGHTVNFSEPDFGPGATFALGGSESTLVDKLKNLPDVTPHAHDLAIYHILDKMPLYAISCGLVRREKYTVELATRHLPLSYGNKLAFVPKTATEHRVICIEPGANMLLQKSLGKTIRDSLGKWGLHLDPLYEPTDLEPGYRFRLEARKFERQQIHRDLARKSSLDGSLATIDLSSASDTISTSLVKAILPPAWFDVLNQTRSRKTRLPDGSWLFNEKFSSMGNGFTFELETLIFYSICLSMRYHFGKPDDIISVFGDDMIVSSDWASELCSTLAQCGFTVNVKKSFTSGPFRESCGGDFFNGIDVRPTFIKELSHDPTEFKFQLANRLREIGLRMGNGVFCDIRLLTAWEYVVKSIPKHDRCYGPPECGDAAIWQNRESSSGWPKCYSKHSITYVRVRTSKPNFKKRARGGGDFVLAAATYGIPYSGIAPRGAAKSYRIGYRAVAERSAQSLTWR